MKSLYIIRHGETDLNTQKNNIDRIMTQPPDTNLNNNGKRQAVKTGEYFKKHRDPIDLIICSSTLRAKQTAQLIADEIGYDRKNIIYEDKLVEIKLNDKYKDFTRREFKDLRNTDNNVKNFFKFHDKKSKIKNPIEYNEFVIKYESAKTNDVYESMESITNRLNSIIGVVKSLPSKNILIVTHGGICRWLNKLLTNNIGPDVFNGKLINNKTNCAITYFINQGNDFYLVCAQSNYHIKDKE